MSFFFLSVLATNIINKVIKVTKTKHQKFRSDIEEKVEQTTEKFIVYEGHIFFYRINKYKQTIRKTTNEKHAKQKQYRILNNKKKPKKYTSIRLI